MKLYFKVLAFLKEDKGLTTVEYAIAGGLVALAVVGAFVALGDAVGDEINAMTNCIANGVCV